MAVGLWMGYASSVFRGPGYPITCIALTNCLGLRTTEVLDSIFAGSTGLEERRFAEDLAAPYVGVVGAVGLPGPAGAGRIARQSRLAWAGAEQVAAACRAACQRWGSERLGLILGTSTGGIAASERAYAALRQGLAIPEHYSFEKQHAFNGVADALARELGIFGPTYVVSTACSSSAKALAAAGRLIATGVCDGVLVGGVDSLCLTTLLGFQSLGVVSSRGCQPFAADRDGITIGEGAAFLLLEREGDAPAFLLSVGETSDAHHMAHPHPEGRGAELAMRQAIDEAGVEAHEVGYVNAHGTGTEQNDAIEASAIARVFGRSPLVSSTKASTGHLLGACGVTEALFCVAAIERASVPGNGPSAVPAALAIDVCRTTTPRALDYALSNSLAFGGSNASVLLASKRAMRRRLGARAPRPKAMATALRSELVQVAVWHPDTPVPEPVSDAAPPALLSPRAQGRASVLTRIFTALLEQLRAGGFDTARSPLVFGSAYGEMATTMQLLDVQANTQQSSPLRFQHSVHNTAAGILSIASGNAGFSTSIAAGMDTTAMALLEAMVVLEHTGLPEIAVLVADEASASALASRQHRAVGAGFWLRRWTPGAGARTRLGAPERSKPQCPSPRESDATLSQNPVVDALRLVHAFRTGQRGAVILGGPEPSLPDASRWLVQLEHDEA